MEIHVSGCSEGRSNCSSFSAFARSRRRRVCQDSWPGEDIKEIHELSNSFRVILTGTVVNSIRRVEVSVRRAHAAIEAR